ncbi:MAG: hypothetical protein KJO88_09955 [Gammaproteobacteria bacterium]|nr:hypothetical protein [Gammaproteobacteria bacterium]NNM12783.1 hypothetical protein [Gammaproteobacteria bacterium]
MTIDTKPKSTNLFNDQVPIAIGITGHRNIHPDAIDRIRQQLTKVFTDLKISYPNSPLVLLTPLAEGADQLAAEVALEQGVEIYAVLPMTQDEYGKDFSTSEQRKRFDRLFDTAVCHKSLNKFDPQAQRDLCYAYVGKWLVDHSDLMLALWNGETNDLTGGTAEVVNYAVNNVFPSLKTQLEADHWPRDKKAVIHIDTLRRSEDQSKEQSEREMVYLESGQRAQDIQNIPYAGSIAGLELLSQIEKYNQTTADATEPGYPLTTHEESKLPLHLRFLHRLYRKSDNVANSYQKSFRAYTQIFFTLTAILLLILLLYFRVLPFTYVIVCYLVVYLITLLVSMRLRNTDAQKKYQLYRLLGETSRLFFFFAVSEETTGQRHSVLNSAREAHYFLRKLGDENRWIMNLFRKKELYDPLASKLIDKETADVAADALQTVKNHWVHDQHKYFSNASQRDRGKLVKLNRIGLCLFVLSFISGVLLLLIKYAGLNYSTTIVAVLGMAIAASAGLGGIVKSYAFTMGYSELAGRYELMESLFSEAYQRISSEQDEAVTIIDQLWWEAFMENIEWFSLKNSRMVNTIDIKKFVKELINLTRL